jgi:CheY-like chemotaxis protein
MLVKFAPFPTLPAGLHPLIVLTAYSSDEDRARPRLGGFRAHIAKPVEPPLLLDLLASFRFRGR